MKSEIDSILLANWYLVKCKLDDSKNSEIKSIARNFLTQKINKVLTQRINQLSQESIKLKDHR